MRVKIYNKTLNPDFWTSDKQLKNDVRVSLLKIAKTLIQDLELKIHIRDIYFLGSSANYNWHQSSDVDLHLLIDFNDLQTTPELAKQFTKSLTKSWNAEHDIYIKGHNVEVYIQDITEENRSTGVFSLISNRWVKEALPQKVVLNKQLIQQKYTTWVNRINSAIKSEDVEKIKNTLKDLTKMREVGLSSTGEFSTENIVFKVLRQTDLIGKLKTSAQQIKNKNLSLKERDLNKEEEIQDAYDPQSMGPNCCYQDRDNFYKMNNSEMRKM